MSRASVRRRESEREGCAPSRTSFRLRNHEGDLYGQAGDERRANRKKNTHPWPDKENTLQSRRAINVPRGDARCICHTRARVHARARARICPYPLALSNARATLVTATLRPSFVPIWICNRSRLLPNTPLPPLLCRDVSIVSDSIESQNRSFRYSMSLLSFDFQHLFIALSSSTKFFSERPTQSSMWWLTMMNNEPSSRTFTIWLSIFLWRAIALYFFLIAQDFFVVLS